MSVKENQDSLLDIFLDGLDQGEYPAEELLALEKQLHHGESGVYQPENPMGLDGWSLDHSKRYPNFGSRQYARGIHPAQKLDTYSTKPSKLLYFIPRGILSKGMESTYKRKLPGTAEQALIAFSTTPAEKGKTLEEAGSVMKAIGEKAHKKESGTVLTSHAESLDDVGTYHGATAISLGRKRSRHVRKAGVFLNKAQSRENYKGKPIENQFKFFGEVIWTLPQTNSAEKWGIPKTVREAIFRGTLRAIKEGRKKGMWLTQAPVGRGMEQKFDPEIGQNVLHQENMHLATAHLISEFANFVVTAAWEGKVSVSPLHQLKKLEGLKRDEQKRTIIRNANRIQLMLAKQTADLAQMPVVTKLRRRNGEETQRVIYPGTLEDEKLAA